MDAKQLAKDYINNQRKLCTELVKLEASILSSLPISMSYETWKHLHEIKGD